MSTAAMRGRYREAVPTPGRALRVDLSPGSSAGGAFASAGEALQAARPGDRILLGPGRHGRLDVLDLHGEADAWISIEPADWSDPPIIDVRRARSDGIDVQCSSFVGLLGLVVEGDAASEHEDASGVCVFRGSRCIRVQGCRIRGFPGGGINCFWMPSEVVDGTRLPAGGWDCVDLVGNTITDCCTRSPSNTSGISFFGAEELTGTTLPGGFGYRAVGNSIKRCRCEVPFSRGGFDFVTDGNGISVDSLHRRDGRTAHLAPYRKRGLIDGNLLQHNGGRGVHVYNSSNVVVRRNLALGNLTTDSPAFAGAAEIEATTTDGHRALLDGVEQWGNVVDPLPHRSPRGGGRSG